MGLEGFDHPLLGEKEGNGQGSVVGYLKNYQLLKLVATILSISQLSLLQSKVVEYKLQGFSLKVLGQPLNKQKY